MAPGQAIHGESLITSNRTDSGVVSETDSPGPGTEDRLASVVTGASNSRG